MCRACHKNAVTKITAATATTISARDRHSVAESLNMPNATPRFSECTMSKKPGMMR